MTLKIRIRPFREFDLVGQNLSIMVKIDITGQNKPIKAKIDHKGQN